MCNNDILLLLFALGMCNNNQTPCAQARLNNCDSQCMQNNSNSCPNNCSGTNPCSQPIINNEVLALMLLMNSGCMNNNSGCMNNNSRCAQQPNCGCNGCNNF